MNRIFRLVWNEEHQECVPAPETARRRNKRSSKKAGKVIQAAASVLLGLFLTQPVWAQTPIGPNTLPTGGEVIHGQASISQNANQMHINQGSDKVILHWQGFDIGRDAHVDFAQPSSSSVALIRVVAGEASQIHGQLTANAQVWLINPRGVVFGQGSKVDVGGLVTSTLDTTNEDFLAGKMNFSRG
ncbi:MAG: filamentous hemagglutinin N-terminal domain-containing protein, partial [Desulfovibrionales bacterium]|nr:filamentous hemagglutinin N-terminal domain-containing protein [Desulfovibrionales bacterium]